MYSSASTWSVVSVETTGGFSEHSTQIDTMQVTCHNTEDKGLDDDMLDIDFISSQSSTASSQTKRETALTAGNTKVLAYVDATLNQIMSAISEGLPLKVDLKRATSMERSTQNMDVDAETASSVTAQVRHRCVTYVWPGRNLSEEWRFGMFIGEAQFILNQSRLQPILI